MSNLVKYNDPVLYSKTTLFNFEEPQIDPHILFEELKGVMIENKGYGVSANQIGTPYSVFVMGNWNDPDKIIPVFNPKIVDISPELVTMEEGCLSFPGLNVKMDRPSKIRVRYTNQNGVTDTIKFEGLTARIFQHEMCHLLGEPFFFGSGKLKLILATKRCTKKTGIVYNAQELLHL